MRFVREDEALRIIGLFSDGTGERGISKSVLKNLLVRNIILSFPLILTIEFNLLFFFYLSSS